MAEFDPPEHLSDRAKALWRSVVPKKARSPGRLAAIQTALENLDLADRAAAAIKADGIAQTTKTTGVVRSHPAAKVAIQARREFCRTWCDRLKLSWDQTEDGVMFDVWQRNRQKADKPPVS